METVVVLVAGGQGVAEELWQASPGSVLVRHDLRDLGQGVVRRWVDGALAVLELAHGCVSCTVRLDLVPLLRSLRGRVVVDLDPALEPEAVCRALAPHGIGVAAVVTAIDPATWLADVSGDVTLGERGSGVPDDDRTVAQVVVGQAESADLLVVRGPRDPVVEAVLDRLAPGVPRVSRVDGVLPARPDRRPGHAFGPLLRGRPPLEADGGVAVVHFAERRPFHPMRLHDAVDVLLDGVVRARGRLWVVSQPDTALWLESAGGGLHVGAAGPWLAALDDWSGVDGERRARAAVDWHPRFGDRAQELVVITHRASPDEIAARLRAALVTDEELDLADELDFADPFAEWHELGL
ncbi:GTP-binding protein [Actinosynnema sp. NPDC050436]|uniref:ribosome hibernation factor-recruiting GTPase MRF n=1 Tax=Actinosynnema sp. NPDC050436 TaxID=3155659 RepID=UPI0033E02981